MKKVRINIVETMKYNRELVMEVPEEMTEQQLESLVMQVERAADGADGVGLHMIRRAPGSRIVEDVDHGLEHPDEYSIEIDDYDII